MGERKLAFFEIGRGKCGLEMQEEFEKAHDIAVERGVPVKVTLTMTVFPPEKDDPRYGSVKYSITRTNPPKQSIKHLTVLQKGMPIADGRNRDEAMNLQLDLEPPTVENQIELPKVAEGGK